MIVCQILNLRKEHTAVLSILSSKGESEALDFQDITSRFTLDAASEFLFGQNLGMLSYDKTRVRLMMHLRACKRWC